MTTLMLPAPTGGPALPVNSTAAVVITTFLGRYRGLTRQHTASDLRCLLAWCADNGLDPLTARRAELKLLLRWMQDTPGSSRRRCRAGSRSDRYYRTAVFDRGDRPVTGRARPPTGSAGGIAHARVDAPAVEALLTTAREPGNVNDFALVAMLGLLGLRISEAVGDVTDLGEEHGQWVLRVVENVVGNGGKTVLVPLPPAVARAIDRAVDRLAGAIPRTRDGTRIDRHAPPAGSVALPTRLGCGCRDAPAYAAAHLRHHARRRRRPAGCADRRPARRPTHHHALRPSPDQPRPTPQLHAGRAQGPPAPETAACEQADPTRPAAEDVRASGVDVSTARAFLLSEKASVISGVRKVVMFWTDTMGFELA